MISTLIMKKRRRSLATKTVALATESRLDACVVLQRKVTAFQPSVRFVLLNVVVAHGHHKAGSMPAYLIKKSISFSSFRRNQKIKKANQRVLAQGFAQTYIDQS
jgi:hypothetical protein